MFDIKYVGDLSKADAFLLAYYGWRSDNILEFGAGASTQIFAQCKPKNLISVETDPNWIERTRANLATLGLVNAVQFADYHDIPSMQYDVIFVDGVWMQRQDFALKTWRHLSESGVMIFHDTRRWYDAENVSVILKKHYAEIYSVLVNHAADPDEGPSNCTVIMKRPLLEYKNWNEVEGKEPWMWGDGEPQELERWPTV